LLILIRHTVCYL